MARNREFYAFILHSVIFVGQLKILIISYIKSKHEISFLNRYMVAVNFLELISFFFKATCKSFFFVKLPLNKSCQFYT